MTDPTASDDVQFPWGDDLNFYTWLSVWGLSAADNASLLEQFKQAVRHGFTQGQQQADRELVEVLTTLVKAMREYEMDTDESPPFRHTQMMKRANAVLAKHATGGGA